MDVDFLYMRVQNLINLNTLEIFDINFYRDTNPEPGSNPVAELLSNTWISFALHSRCMQANEHAPWSVSEKWHVIPTKLR